MGADVVFAWPTAEIAVMGAEGAVNILYSRELKAIEDPEAKKAKRRSSSSYYRAEFASPYLAAAKGYITDIIEPEMTRGDGVAGAAQAVGQARVAPGRRSTVSSRCDASEPVARPCLTTPSPTPCRTRRRCCS